MGIQTMGSQGNGQQPHLQPSPLTRQSSWYNLTLDEVKNQLGDMGKPVGSMNLDELLQKVWTAEANQSMVMDNDNSSSASSLQREPSATLARALSGKTVDQVWTEIQQGQNKRYGEGPKGQDSSMKLGETTLEDFLVQAGLFAEASVGPTMGLDIVEAVTPQNFPQNMGLSSSPSTCSLSDTTASGWKRTASDTFEKTLDRRLKRKIKNRESAARSRARKQAYHNELVSKVSHLEEENTKLKKEKEFDKMLPCESSSETKYQLRRTSSASF
ncbi:ABSCISIC ACID-INSENSITIVE 5-like protein 2 [Carya illinoinensis]|uniref:ABSCISIC ACID-INSENSITIVE 5-like protein 2 n=1 Tax=Carya illinoinensis TaxID=32201 RepID=UPI001C71DA21|nr:ABSCISIC ACID-INSENSITIVE 5-like protein 2 [Carya illinoinensis]XP_042959167.1 ABSCISIC ACID-INSENSITIVE 5-like protein 2 [Carya illinoinensis]XP_042959168.1 ABSCISIC ACID-INSENSITIVE 5-like protein 2 [Carya illinoinensis]